MTIGTVKIIDPQTLDIEFFDHHHYVAPHLAKEFAEEILARAEEARQSGPRCRCGHLVEDHGFFNGDSHPSEDKETGVCGCVFSQNEAMLHAAGLDPERIIQPGDSLETRYAKELETSQALLDFLKEERGQA